MKLSKNFKIFLLVLCLLVGGFFGRLIFEKKDGPLVSSPPPAPPTTIEPAPSANNPSPTPVSPTPTPQELPRSYSLKVPFTPQAPTANWDELHNEACEEASMIMAHAYFSGIKDSKLAPEFVEQEITKLTEWEKENFGYYLDINAEETARVLREVYGLKAKVVNGYTEEGIKRELMQNHVVLILADGRELGNPNFRQPGPPYHMVVVKGWDAYGFITNDPGTRKGLNYPYTFETLYSAGGDWRHDIHGVDQGTKASVVVWK